MKTALSESDRAEILEGLQAAGRFADYWDSHAAELMAKYGGQWVLFAGTRVVGHSPTPAALEPIRKGLATPWQDITLRYVPRKNERFVL